MANFLRLALTSEPLALGVHPLITLGAQDHLAVVVVFFIAATAHGTKASCPIEKKTLSNITKDMRGKAKY